MGKNLLKLNGKTVILKNFTSKESLKKVENVLLEVYADKKYSWLFPEELECVVYEDTKKKFRAFVFPTGLVKGIFRVYFNLANLEYSEKQFKGSFIHELVHVYQYTANAHAINFNKAYKKIHEVKYFENVSDKGRVTPLLIFKSLRIFLRRIIEECWCEGLAHYFEEYISDEKKLLRLSENSEKQIGSLYAQSVYGGAQFVNLWNEVIRALGSKDFERLKELYLDEEGDFETTHMHTRTIGVFMTLISV